MFEYARVGSNMASGLDEYVELIQQEGVCETFRAWAHRDYVITEGIAWVDWTCWVPTSEEDGFFQEDNAMDDPDFYCKG